MRLRHLALALMLLATTGCPPQVEIWLAPDASIESPRFLLGKFHGERGAVLPTLIRVDNCEALGAGSYPPAETAAWFVTHDEGAQAFPEFMYGSPPDGYDELRPAIPLDVGQCYAVTGLGSGELRFRVAEDGRFRAVVE